MFPQREKGKKRNPVRRGRALGRLPFSYFFGPAFSKRNIALSFSAILKTVREWARFAPGIRRGVQ